MQASEMEKHAATALYEQSEETKTTIHFDTTGHSSVNVEWPSIIPTFLNGEEYRLRPLFFIYEDRQQLTTLFVETFTQLDCGTNECYTEHVAPSILWAKVGGLMAVAATKNFVLKILFQMPLVRLIIHSICFAKAILLKLLISHTYKSLPALIKLLTSNSYLRISILLCNPFLEIKLH